MFDNKSLIAGKKIYGALIAQMKADGWTVESYLITLIYDERAKKTSSLQKLLGIVDIQTEREIPMLYTSGLGNVGIIPAYYHAKQPVALGSTGGGVNIEGIELASLSWEELARDLLVAKQYTNEIHIFCLETSYARGFLPRIKTFDFNQPVPDISKELQAQTRQIKFIQALLVILDHPLLLTLVLLALLSGLLWLVYKLIRIIIKRVMSK